MKMLSIAAVVAAVISLAMGAWMVVSTKCVLLLTPNGLLRVTDTALLFAIALMLLKLLLEKKA